jgi:hypothetical protein
MCHRGAPLPSANRCANCPSDDCASGGAAIGVARPRDSLVTAGSVRNRRAPPHPEDEHATSHRADTQAFVTRERSRTRAWSVSAKSSRTAVGARAGCVFSAAVSVGNRRRRHTRRLEAALRRYSESTSLLTALGHRAWPEAPDREHLLDEARHQADLFRHPYVDAEHVLLAAAWLEGDQQAYDARCAQLQPGLPVSRWRPLGFRSARRRSGQAEIAEAQRQAKLREHERQR